MSNPGFCKATRYAINHKSIVIFHLREPEGVEGIAGGNDEVLNAIELVGDGRVAHARTQFGMPQYRSVFRVERDQIGCAVTCKQEVARGAEQSRTYCSSRRPFVRPSDFAGLIVDGFQHAFGPSAAIVATPAFGL